MSDFSFEVWDRVYGLLSVKEIVPTNFFGGPNFFKMITQGFDPFMSQIIAGVEGHMCSQKQKRSVNQLGQFSKKWDF